MRIWSWFDQAIPTNSYGLKFYSDWKIRLFQFLAEISDCGRDFKFGREFQTIKHHQKYGLGEIFCPGREFPIRSIFKTEIIRTKIVDWGFSRYPQRAVPSVTFSCPEANSFSQDSLPLACWICSIWFRLVWPKVQKWQDIPASWPVADHAFSKQSIQDTILLHQHESCVQHWEWV